MFGVNRTFSPCFSDGRGPGNAIRYTFEGSVEDLVSPAQPNVLYYLQVRVATTFWQNSFTALLLHKIVHSCSQTKAKAPETILLYHCISVH